MSFSKSSIIQRVSRYGVERSGRRRSCLIRMRLSALVERERDRSRIKDWEEEECKYNMSLQTLFRFDCRVRFK